MSSVGFGIFENHMARLLDTQTSGFGLSPLCSERPFRGRESVWDKCGSATATGDRAYG